MPFKPIYASQKPQYDLSLASPPPTAQIPTWKSEAEQQTTTPVFFWKPDEDYGYLCQWYPSPFTAADGQTFNCCEQYMMYHKAKTFADTDCMAAILAEKKPRAQKALGRRVSGFDEAVWDAVKYAVVVQGNRYKFAQCRALDWDGFVYPPDGWVEGLGDKVSLRELLVATGERGLAEASRFDRVWGIGCTAEVARRTSEGLWGQNLLGKALMEVRRELSDALSI